MSERYLEAKLKTPFVMLSVDLPGNELMNASIITEARKQLVYKMREALIKKAAELDEYDLKFELIGGNL